MTITTAPTLALTAREYLRVSVDRSGRGRSTGEQHDDNDRAASERTWTLGAPYRDDNRSASRYATKAREDFDRLVGDLEADRFGADVLILWESSRGSRKVSEWVTLIELCERRGVLIHVTTHGRTYDPGNARDRRSLLEDSVDSEYESSKIRDRSVRAMAANARAGKPHGRTPYGYRRRYHEVTREFIAQDPHPDEAPVVRELFDRIVAGHSLRSIARDYAERGITTRTGRPWTPEHLRSLAITRAYVGERVHVPGRKSRTGPADAKPQIVKAQWDALVPRATFLAVQRILSAPERRTSRPGRAVHLMSMIARCDVCGGPMVVTLRRTEPEYQCQNGGHVRIRKADLDDLAQATMLDYLTRDDVYEALSADGDSEQLAKARDEVEAIRAELDDLAEQVGSGALSATLAARAEPGIVRRLKAAEDRETDLATPSRLRGLITPGEKARQEWKAAPMSTRREVARMLLAPDMLGEMRVMRSPSPGHRVPAGDRVHLIDQSGRSLPLATELEN